MDMDMGREKGTLAMTLKSGKFRSMELSEKGMDTPMRTIMDFMTSE